MEVAAKAPFTLKQILRDNWDHFLSVYRSAVTWYAAFNVWKVMNCREPDGLGYVTFACPDHPLEVCHIPRSCKSRFCSVCAKVQVDRWVADMNQLFPNCSYFHVTFTVPSQFRTLLFAKRALLNAVFSAAAETLLSFCKEQGFMPAITAVLHTFGSDLKRHVHIHFIISAGGLKLSGKAERYTRFIRRKAKDPSAKMRTIRVLEEDPRWISWSTFPYRMLQKRYQALLLRHLKEKILRDVHSDDPDPDLKVFATPSVMAAFFDDLKAEYRNGFFVHSTEERKDLSLTAGYLGRYARRPPLSEIRIKRYTGDYVTFEFKDYRSGGSKALYTLKSNEFIRNLVQHVPPHYFNLIRHYGLLASRVKAKYKAITDCLLANGPVINPAPKWRERQTEFRGEDPLLCRICRRVKRFVSAHLPTALPDVKRQAQATFA